MADSRNIPISDKRFWEHFIESYRNLPCLWEVTNQDYTNKDLRRLAYERLVNICKRKWPHANKDFVTKRISNMRTCYRRELKKVQESEKIESALDEVYVPTLWYFNSLKFLDDDETGTGNRSPTFREVETDFSNEDSVQEVRQQFI